MNHWFADVPHVLVVWPLRLDFLATFAPHFARPRLPIASRLHGGAIQGKLVMVSLLRDMTVKLEGC